MPRKPQALVLDSWAALAYLDDEASAQEVADLITNAHENRIPMVMSVVNAGEVWTILAREISEAQADNAVTDLAGLGIELTGAWVDREKGLISVIALEMGSSADLLAYLQPGEPVILMGPTGARTRRGSAGSSILL